MKDKLIEHRLKSKFVIEIRHEPMLDLFDRKGEIISKLHPAIKSELKHWRVQNNEISFLDHLVFTRDEAFSSPSAAAAVVHGGHANGLIAWKGKNGKTLKEIESA